VCNSIKPLQNSPLRHSVATIPECEAAWREARLGQPAKLREIVSRESLRRSSMTLLGRTEDTRVSKWLLQIFSATARRKKLSDFQTLVDAEAHGIDVWASAPLLHQFASYSFDRGIDFLLASGTDVNAGDRRGCTALHYLVYSRQDQASKLKTLELLLAAGATLKPFPWGTTVLTEALRRKFTSVAAALIAHGANVNETDRQNFTALDLLLQRAEVFRHNGGKLSGHVNLLLSAGADLNHNPNGMTPLHQAVAHASAKVVELLVQHGAVVDAPGPADRSPLFFLVENRWEPEEILNVLVRHGANLQARDKDNLTAAEAMAAAGNPELAGLLASHGG
jgi:ankyrin repeat protein